MRDACRLTEVSERAAFKWLAAHRADVDEVVAFITPLLQQTKKDIEAIAKAEWQSAMEKRLGMAAAAIDKGLVSDDKYLEAADRVAAYGVGKPANKHVIEGDITHTQVYAIDPGTLAVLNKIASGSGPLYDSAKALASPQKLLNG